MSSGGGAPPAQSQGQTQLGAQSRSQPHTGQEAEQAVIAEGATGAAAERDRELEVSPETVEAREPFQASGQRRQPITAPALAWAAAVLLSAIGAGVGLRRRQRAVPAVVTARARAAGRRSP